jgi:hypothetical protein
MPSNFKKPGDNDFKRRGPGGPRPDGSRPSGPRPSGSRPGWPRSASARSGRPGPRYGSRGGSRSGYTSRSSRSPANSQPPDNTPVPEGLVFYCKSCEQIVDFKPTSFNFKYPIENCLKEKSKKDAEKKAEMMCDIAYGTERSIKHYYKIKDEKFDAERRAREEKAQRADKF